MNTDKYAVDIHRHGAVGDGVTLDTRAIQSAIDACAMAGGGTVLIPPGRWRTGRILLRTNVVLHLSAGATLLGSTDLADYGKEEALIHAKDVINVAIEGMGTIDGQGASFDIPDEHLPYGAWGGRPRILFFQDCTRVRISGVRLVNSAFWACHLLGCTDVVLTGMSIDSRVRLNNDGIDIDSCERVAVSNCIIRCGDDGIAFKTNIERPCRDVTVSNCFIQTRWAGIRIGPESIGGYSNIAVSNCVMRDVWGCAIKLQIWEYAVMENISFSNITMEDVTGPIHMRIAGWEKSPHANWGNLPDWMAKREVKPFGVMRNIRFSGITARVLGAPPIHDSEPKRTVAMQDGEVRSCLSVCGAPGYPIENVLFNDMHIEYAGGGTAEEAAREIPDSVYGGGEIGGTPHPEYYAFGVMPAWGAFIRHARDIRMKNVTMCTLSPDARPEVVVVHTEGFVRNDVPAVQRSPEISP